MFARLDDEFGRIDFVANIAGEAVRRKPEDISLASVTALGRGHIAYSMAMGAVVQMTRELSTE